MGRIGKYGDGGEMEGEWGSMERMGKYGEN